MSLARSISILLASSLMTVSASYAQYFPSNLDPVQSIFVVYNPANKTLVEKYFEIVQNKNKMANQGQQIQLHILVQNDLLSEVTKKVPAAIKSNVHITASKIAKNDSQDPESAGVNDDWLQDVGEFFWTKENKPSFVFYRDPKDTAENFMTSFPALLETKQIQTVRATGALQEMDSIEGGNIEATPGGTVYVGKELNLSLRKKIESIIGADKVIQVPTSHSSVAHVDESYQFVPDNSADNSCKYALVKTDFIDGLRIAIAFNLFNSKDENRDTGEMRIVTTEQYIESISYFTGATKKEITQKITNKEFNNTYFLELLKKFNFKKSLRPFSNIFGFKKEDVYVYKVFVAQKSIIEGVRLLSERAAKEGCASLKQITSPALWTYPVFSEDVPFLEEEEVYKTTPVSNMTAFTNFVLINDTIVIPDTVVPFQLYVIIEEMEFKNIGNKFKEIFNERLKKIGFQDPNIHYVEMPGSLLGDGAAHCKTNVLRKKK